MTREQRRKISTVIRYTLLVAVGFVMVYPLIWMVGATFKTNSEIFTSAWFWPKNPVFDGYDNAFKSYGGKINLLTSMLNTYKIVVPKVIFTIISATITAYGFARFDFKGKGIMFSLMMATLFLPQVVLNAPQYIMFNNWGWTNSYLPLVIPSLFAADTYFVFMLIQFLRGVPKELEEAAKIDGANGWRTFWSITVPLLKPTIIMTFIMSINGTLQLFDESVNLTSGGPANATITMSHYIYNTCFLRAPNFGYGSAMAFFVFIIVAILAFINLKVGDTRD